MLGFWLLLLLVLIAISALPTYPYSRDWGYSPSSAIGLLLLAVLILIWFDIIAFSWPWSI